MKKPFHQRVGDFLEGKGFYIVLFLCVAAIGISGYFLFASLTRDEPAALVAATAKITVTPTPAPVRTPAQPEHSAPAAARPSAGQTPAAASTPAPSASPVPAPSAAPSPEPTPQTAPTSFAWPVQGELVAAFSVEELVYNATMGDWRTHDGLDIAAAQGSQVCAAADGTVSAVTEDPLMGVCVTITHGGGMTTTYANLAAETMVEAGDHVNTGQVLGTVGDTAIAESALASHLHFSMALDGDAVDPAGYLS